MSDKINIGDIIKLGHLEWRVLDVQAGKVLIISKESACNSKFNENDGFFSAVMWDNSDIRSYLNDNFLNTITNQNPDLVMETKIKNDKNRWYGTSGVKDTIDKIFLLSIEEVEKYFGNSDDYRKNRVKSDIDKKTGKEENRYISNDYDSSRKIEKAHFSYMGWWLRSPGESKYKSAYVNEHGVIVVSGDYISDHKNIRPAMWIKQDLAETLKNGTAISEINSTRNEKVISEYKKIEFGPYYWRILETQDDKALIITEDIISECQYRSSYYLNGTFLERFSEEERERMIETQIPDDENLWYETKRNSETSKKVFLLSVKEADKYFGNSEDYVSKRRKKYGGVEEEPTKDNTGKYLSNNFNSERIANYENKPKEWWLRSAGEEECYATYYPGGQVKGSELIILNTYVRRNGSIDVHGVTDNNYNPKFGTNEIKYGLRPALWLQGYQDFYKDDTKQAEPAIWPPQTEPEKAQLMRNIPSLENARYIYNEGYVYFIPEDGIMMLIRIRSDGTEKTVLHSTGNKRGDSGGWHRSETNSFSMGKIEDGYLYINERSYGDNDYSDWDYSYIYRLKLAGQGELMKYRVSVMKNDPGGGENYTVYYDDDGNIERTEHH